MPMEAALSHPRDIVIETLLSSCSVYCAFAHAQTPTRHKFFNFSRLLCCLTTSKHHQSLHHVAHQPTRYAASRAISHAACHAVRHAARHEPSNEYLEHDRLPKLPGRSIY